MMNKFQARKFYRKIFANYPDVLTVEDATNLLGFKSQTGVIRRIHQNRIDKTLPKGTIVLECGNAMLKNGYKLKILNTINFSKSMHYNPFSYVHSEKDILKLVTTLMTNTKGEGSGEDPFWEKSERLLLTALIAYLHYEAPVEEQNFATLLEDDEEYQNPVDLLFEELAKKKPNSFAGRQYKLYKLAAGKTAKSILVSCGARLAPFDI